MAENRRLYPKAGAGVVYRNPVLSQKEIRFRVPTDQDYVAFQRRLGRAADTDARLRLAGELLESLSTGEPIGLEDAEADLVLGRLERWQASPEGRDGLVVVSGPAFLGIACTHVFRMPSLGELHHLGREEAKEGLMLRAHEQFWRQHVEADQTEGYEGEPPIWHKSRAVVALSLYCDRLSVEEEGGDFFDPAAAGESGAANGAA